MKIYYRMICLVCGHDVCPGCGMWCDNLGCGSEFVTCCDTDCVYSRAELERRAREEPDRLVEQIMAASLVRSDYEKLVFETETDDEDDDE